MSAESAPKQKVLHIIHGFGPGGVETWLLATVKYLHAHPEMNMQFDFLATGGTPKIFDEEVKRYGSKIYYARYSNKSIVSFRNSFRKILSENKYIAVHDHEDFISGWHFLLAGKHLPPIRISHLHNPYNFVHNYVVNSLRKISFRVGRKLMAKHTSKITGTSNAVMDEYGYDKEPFVTKRIAPAYCGFDTNTFIFDPNAKQAIVNELGWNSDAKIALFVGRIGLQSYDKAANQKNPEFAFEVAKTLVSQYGDWNFLFVGFKGDTGEKMEKELGDARLANRIKFLGIRHDIPAIMSAADVFVFPSLWEGLGMVAVEAQCTGLPVLMSDGVPREAVVTELVKIKKLNDGPASWAEVIAQLPAVANRKQYAGIVRSSPFSIENSVNRLLSLYEH